MWWRVKWYADNIKITPMSEADNIKRSALVEADNILDLMEEIEFGEISSEEGIICDDFETIESIEREI